MTGGRRTGTRAVLASATCAGLVYLWFVAVARPGLFGLNYEVFYGAATALLAGDPLYGVAHGRYAYLVYSYPPLTLLAFVPFTLLPSPVAFSVHTALSLACAALAARLLLGYLERRGVTVTRADRLLVYGFCLASPLSMPSTVFGQLNLPLALLFVVGLTRLGRDSRAAGAAFGLAAFVKVFPAVVGGWLLYRRDWSAVGAATAVGVGGLLGGLLLGPELTLAWVESVVTARAADGAFAGGLDPSAAYLTLQRPLSYLFESPTRRTLAALALVAPVVGFLLATLDPTTLRGELVGVYAAVAGALLVLPSYPVYYVLLFVPVLGLCYTLEGRAHRVALVGTLLLAIPLRLDDVRRGLAPLGGVGDAALGVFSPVLTLASTALVGALLLFVACLLAETQSS